MNIFTKKNSLEIIRSHALSKVIIWLVCSISLAILGSAVGLKSVLPGPASREVLTSNPGEVVASDAGIPLRDKLIIVLKSNSFDTVHPEFISLKDSLYQMLYGLKHESGNKLFHKIQTLGQTNLEDRFFVSEDNHNILFIAETSAALYSSAESLRLVPQILQSWIKKHPEFELYYVSSGTADTEIFELIHSDLDRSLIITIPLTLLILLWAFGSFVAALVPILVAAVSLIASLGMAALISNLFGSISVTATQLVIFLVIAVGVDYSLFVISRMREEVLRGLSYDEAIRLARLSAGRAVFWSGLTVALSLSGLFLMQDTVLTSMALVSIIAVLIAMFSAVSILPSILIIIGPRIELGKLHFPIILPGVMNNLLSFSITRPLKTLIVGVLVIIIPAVFCLFIKVGTTIEPEMLPQTMQSIKTYEVIKSKFPNLVGQDLSIIITASDLKKLDGNSLLDEFFDELSSRELIRGPVQVEESVDGTVKRLHYLIEGSSNDSASHKLVDDLRSWIFPKYLEPHGIKAYLGGTLPFVVDESERYAAKTPLVIFSVLVFSIIFLLCAFRSIVVPIKAIILNLLSSAAAFGFLVILFQYGQVPGWNYGVIEGFVPALLFSILFGLSMDYHVFLLSRINEEVVKGASTREAVAVGITTTSRTITAAALIMISVFSVIATLELPVMKQLGVGLALAVFLDATIIRNLLLPAGMVLLGRLNWYFPKCLKFLPNIRIE